MLNKSVSLTGVSIDIEGNGGADMQVRGLVYSDIDGSPGKLLAASTVVCVDIFRHFKTECGN
jgi:hypothetical protein